MHRCISTFGLYLTMLLLASCQTPPLYTTAEFMFKEGNNHSFFAKTTYDSGWKIAKVPVRKNAYLAQFSIPLTQTVDSLHHLGVSIHAFGAFEVFWDGVWIGNNGAVWLKGRKEQPGTESSCFLVPGTLTRKGMHNLTLRVSQYYKTKQYRGISIKVGDYQNMVRQPLVTTAFMYLLAGAFLIVCIFYFFLFVHNRKQKSALLFSIICFLFFTLLFTEYAKYYIDIPYTHFDVRLLIIGSLTFAVSFLVPFYFALQFSFPRRKTLLAVLLLCSSAVFFFGFRHYDVTAQRLAILMWAAALIVAGYAVRQKVRGGILVMAGLLLGAIISALFIYDISLFLSFAIIVLCMMYLQVIKSREMEKDYQSSLLTSQRLKTELLKKNIQPHFIKNTLTSLIDWVEESPKDGVAFIHALAGEFELLNQIADATLIPINQEIILCRHHLKVMQFRKEVSYLWEACGINPEELVPPAIIHTALENGITHSAPLEDGTIRFKLLFHQTNDYKQYELWTIGKNRHTKDDVKPGTGFQYIQARLKESYGVDWSFHSQAVQEGWLTSIKICK